MKILGPPKLSPNPPVRGGGFHADSFPLMATTFIMRVTLSLILVDFVKKKINVAFKVTVSIEVNITEFMIKGRKLQLLFD